MSITAAAKPITLSSCVQYDLTNQTTGLDYRIQISWPHNWDRCKQLRNGEIPVIYVLDGNSLFLTASEILWRSASATFYSGGGIIVAIGYQNVPTPTGSLFSSQRNTDLTLNKHEKYEGLGGADAFLDFIEEQVKPLVRNHFTDISIGQEAIFGHSFGGLCVLHSLFTKRGVYSSYFAASPSIWWDAAILDEAEQFCKRQEQDASCKSVLHMSYGSLEAEPHKDPQESDSKYDERVKRCGERKMGTNAVELERRLRESQNLGDLSVIRFEQEDHCSNAGSALLRALTTFFKSRDN